MKKIKISKEVFKGYVVKMVRLDDEVSNGR